MTNQNNEYISSLQLDDFQVLLKEFDIELDQSTQQRLLNMIKNNQLGNYKGVSEISRGGNPYHGICHHRFQGAAGDLRY